MLNAALGTTEIRKKHTP